MGGIGVFQQPVDKFARGAGGVALDHGEVQLANPAFTEHFRQPRGTLRVPREDDNPGNGPVEPMGNTQVDIARLEMLQAQMLFDLPFERGDVRNGSHGQQPGRLVKREERPIFEQGHQGGATHGRWRADRSGFGSRLSALGGLGW